MQVGVVMCREKCGREAEFKSAQLCHECSFIQRGLERRDKMPVKKCERCKGDFKPWVKTNRFCSSCTTHRRDRKKLSLPPAQIRIIHDRPPPAPLPKKEVKSNPPPVRDAKANLKARTLLKVVCTECRTDGYSADKPWTCSACFTKQESAKTLPTLRHIRQAISNLSIFEIAKLSRPQMDALINFVKALEEG